MKGPFESIRRQMERRIHAREAVTELVRSIADVARFEIEFPWRDDDFDPDEQERIAVTIWVTGDFERLWSETTRRLQEHGPRGWTFIVVIRAGTREEEERAA